MYYVILYGTGQYCLQSYLNKLPLYVAFTVFRAKKVTYYENSVVSTWIS